MCVSFIDSRIPSVLMIVICFFRNMPRTKDYSNTRLNIHWLKLLIVDLVAFSILSSTTSFATGGMCHLLEPASLDLWERIRSRRDNLRPRNFNGKAWHIFRRDDFVVDLDKVSSVRYTRKSINHQPTHPNKPPGQLVLQIRTHSNLVKPY